MPKDFTAPSQNWNIQDQINQSKKINQERNKTLDDYNKRTEALKSFGQNLDILESNGVDTTEDRRYFERKSKELELGFGEKLGVVGRNLGNDYVSGASKLIFGNKVDKSYSQQLDEAKQQRETAINPLSTLATEIIIDPTNLIPLGAASSGGKLLRAAKDFGKGAGLASSTYALKYGGDENFQASDALLAGAAGGLLNAGAIAGMNGLSKYFGKKQAAKNGVDYVEPSYNVSQDVTSSDNILSRNPNAKTYKSGNAIEPNDQVNININQTQQPLTQDEIAARLNESLFGNKQQDKIPVNNQPTYDPFRGDFPLNKTTETKAAQQTTDPFTWQPKQQEPKATDTFGFAKDAQRNASLEELRSKIEPLNKVLQQKEHMQNMNMDRVDNSPYIFENNSKPISKLPDTLPLNDKEEMKSIIRYAKDNDAVDEFISKLPQNARVDEVQKFFDNLKPTEVKQDGIIPVTSNIKQPIKNYDIPALQEFEGLTKATGNNTADVLSLEKFTNTQGVRNAIDRYVAGNANQRDYEILDAVQNFMKYEGDNFRQRVGVTKPDASMKIDDAVRNNIDFDTANKAGAIPFSNGTQTFGGASVGGLESEFNQRDYNNDGKHDYKDNIYGVIVGALGINAAKKLFPKAFKDDNLNNDVVAGMLYPKGKPNFKTNGNPKTIVDVTENVRLNAGISNKEVIADAIALKDKHPEFFKTVADVDRHIKKVVDNPNYYFKGTNPDNKLLAKEFNGKLNKVAIEKDGSDYNKLIHATKSSKVNKEINRLLNLEKKDSLERSPTLSLHNGQGNGADALSNYPISDKSISNNIPKSQDERTSNFLRKARERIQAKIDSGEIPEKGRTVISPYDKGKEYYLGESGKVYFKRGNGTWRETPNEETIKDVKYVATNGLSAFKKMRGEENLRFEKALEESKKLEEARNSTYKMDHKAPNKENGVSAYDITDMFSKDIYSKDAARLFGHGSTKMDNESISLINKVRNKPEAEVTIYRAVPKDLDVNINPDDWVTTSKEYAKVHGEGPLKGNYKILEMKVKAKDLYTDGNSIHEWGWSPNTTPNGMIAMSSPTLSGTFIGGVAGANNDLNGDGRTDYKDILIGAVGGAGLTKGALMAKNSQRIARAVETFKSNENVNAIYGFNINKATDYLKLRDDVLKATNQKMEQFSLLHEQLKLLDTPTRNAMYDYMSGKNVQLSQTIKSLADNYINEVDKLSKELVDLGVLDAAQFDKFQGRYLHRRYEKDFMQKFTSLFSKGKTVQGIQSRGREWTGSAAEYNRMLANNEIGDFFQGKVEATQMRNGQYKFRQDWTDEQRARWGEVKDIAFSLPETLMRSSEMVQHATFLKRVLNETGYVLDDATDGYVQLNGKKYGALNGKYVRKDIASDVNEFNQALFGKESDGFSKDFTDTLKSFVSYWKKTHTVYNPVAHWNNLFSNITMQFGAGLNPIKAVANAKRGYEASSKMGLIRQLEAKKIIGLSNEETNALNGLLQDSDIQLWKQASEAGLFGRSKLNDVLMKYIKPSTNNSSFMKQGLLGKIDEKVSAVYQAEDDIMRYSVLKSFLEQGMDFDTAVSKVSTVIPDYTKPMSYLARKMRDTGIAPFISWTYHATPIILNQMKEHPERVAAIYGALYGINQLMGIDPFNEKDIPQQNFSMKRIPIYKDGNEVTTIKVDRWIPHNDIMNPGDFIKNLLSPGIYTPLIEIPRNQNLYFGGKITHNEGALKAYDLTKHALSQVTPDVLDKVGSTAESLIASKNTRTKNPVVQPRSTLQELINLLGINSITYNKSNQARKVSNEKMK